MTQKESIRNADRKPDIPNLGVHLGTDDPKSTNGRAPTPNFCRSCHKLGNVSPPSREHPKAADPITFQQGSAGWSRGGFSRLEESPSSIG